MVGRRDGFAAADRASVAGGPRSSSTRMGFSLLEVMTALTVLAVGVLATTAGQLTALKHSSDSRQHVLAMSLAEQQMEIFRLMDGTDVLAMTSAPGYPNDPNNPIDPIASDDIAMRYDRRWIIEKDQPEAGLIRITVEVDWANSLGVVRTVRLQGFKVET